MINVMSDEDRKARNREYQRKFREKHGERLRDYHAEWRANNPEKVAASRKKQLEANKLRARRWRENPSNREKDIENSRKRYYSDPKLAYKKNRARILQDHESYLEYLRVYSRENAAAASKRAMEWKKANPDKVKLSSAKRKALKLSTTVGPIDFEAIKLKSRMICGICGLVIRADYHFDHIIPLAKGGTHTEDNLQLAHPRCNLSKKDKMPQIKQKAPKGA